MAITFNCAQCGKSYTLDDSLAGKQAKCSCGTEMTVPAPSAPAPPAPAPPAPAPPAPAPPAPVAPAVPASPFAAGQMPPAQMPPAQMPPAQMPPAQMPPAQMAPAPQPYVQQGAMQQVVVNQRGGGKSDKQKLVAALLCWFLGAFGVHRFYLGHTGIGLIQLFTLGMCGIWQFIDFIMILTGGVKDAQGRPLS